ncbi:MAG: hypothetical protein M3N95_12995 [Actinomycetota bacterium]|nr:hypothetical protein [Actinomycetota bacterium]
MINVDLILALATIGASWFALARVLARSLRADELFDTPEGRLAAKTAPWREPPDNRTIYKDLLA